MSRRLQRAVDATSLLFALAAVALAAVALAVWPVATSLELASAPPASLSPTAATDDLRAFGARGPVLDSTAAGIVRGNVFSASRRAPSSRFMPPGTDAATVAMTDMSSAPAGDYAPPATALSGGPGEPAGGTGDAVPALYGIVTIDGVRHALLALRTDEPPRLFAVGDRHAGYRISAIEGDRVVLATSRGSRVLRLAPPAPRDSSPRDSSPGGSLPRDTSENLP